MDAQKLRVAAVVTALVMAGARGGMAQATDSFHACYVPEVGALYVIKLDRLPGDCLADNHVEITWTQGGAGGHAELAGLGNDDHPQYLLADGSRAATDGFAVTGTLNSGAIPVEGAGTRLMWHSRKASFRTGRVTGDQWDDANVGQHSVAMGVNTTASGFGSVAMGDETTASGAFALAMGRGTAASGEYSTTVGLTTSAEGDFSLATGRGTAANGNYATALGISTTASGDRSTALGSTTTASGFGSVAMGGSTTASGDYSTAMGVQTEAAAFASLVIGRRPLTGGNASSWVSTDHLFVAGNGTLTGNVRSNALELYKNGTLVIAGSLFENSDIRYKEDITPIDSVLDRVLALTPIRYRFRPDTGRPDGPRLGLSAQEVEPLFPELVSRDDTGRLSVAYADLSAVLVRALQEQHRASERLRTEMDAVRADNERLIAQVERLQAEDAALRTAMEAFEAAAREVEARLTALEITAARGGR